MRAVFSALVVSSALIACSGGESQNNSSAPTVSATAAQTACSTDTRKDVYAAGMSKPAGTMVVKILESDPGPPIKGTNNLTVELTDASGAPLDGATVTVTPFMPDHGHGSSVVPTVTASGGGKYAVANVYFVMAGLWRVTFTVQPTGGAPAEEAVFNFCLDG